MTEFTHFDQSGNAVMVDVGGKTPTARQAVARGYIRMSPDCFQKVNAGTVGKGDVFGVARVAGIMAAKQAASLIPLCHVIPIEKAEIAFIPHGHSCRVEAVCTVKTTGVTGAEMEALTGVSVALLTVYDMCKAVDKAMTIEAICLVEKTGGKSGVFRREEQTDD